MTPRDAAHFVHSPTTTRGDAPVAWNEPLHPGTGSVGSTRQRNPVPPPIVTLKERVL